MAAEAWEMSTVFDSFGPSEKSQQQDRTISIART